MANFETLDRQQQYQRIIEDSVWAAVSIYPVYDDTQRAAYFTGVANVLHQLQYAWSVNSARIDLIKQYNKYLKDQDK